MSDTQPKFPVEIISDLREIAKTTPPGEFNEACGNYVASLLKQEDDDAEFPERLVGKVLQKIYESEIDLQIGWLYDGGLCYVIKNTPNPLVGNTDAEVISTGETDITKALNIVVRDILGRFPKSAFAEWIRSARF